MNKDQKVLMLIYDTLDHVFERELINKQIKVGKTLNFLFYRVGIYAHDSKEIILSIVNNLNDYYKQILKASIYNYSVDIANMMAKLDLINELKRLNLHVRSNDINKIKENIIFKCNDWLKIHPYVLFNLNYNSSIKLISARNDGYNHFWFEGDKYYYKGKLLK